MLNETNNYIEIAKFYKTSQINDTGYLAYRDIPQIITNHYKNSLPINALDFGCGTGRSSKFLKALGIEKVTGVDRSMAMLSHASAAHEDKIQYVHIQNNQLPFENNFFDYVLSVFVMLEIPDLEEMSIIFKAINRVLKPGHFFTFVTSSENMFNNEWLSLSTSYTKDQIFHNGQKLKVYLKNIDQELYDYYWDNHAYTQTLKNSGFDIINVHHPLGDKNDPYNWKDERFISPYSIFTAQKP